MISSTSSFVGTPVQHGVPFPRRVVPARQHVRTLALFGLGKKQEDDKFVGFRFDPSMQRWIRAPGMTVEKAEIYVTPKSGMPYLVWPVMHTYLVSKKLKSVTQDEVGPQCMLRACMTLPRVVACWRPPTDPPPFPHAPAPDFDNDQEGRHPDGRPPGHRLRGGACCACCERAPVPPHRRRWRLGQVQARCEYLSLLTCRRCPCKATPIAHTPLTSLRSWPDWPCVPQNATQTL